MVLATTILIGAVQAESAPRVPVADLRPLLQTALVTGTARGEWVGLAAAFFAREFGSTAPLLVEVERIESLAHGCARLRVTTRQARVQVPNQPVRDRSFAYALGFCADGRLLEEPNP